MHACNQAYGIGIGRGIQQVTLSQGNRQRLKEKDPYDLLWPLHTHRHMRLHMKVHTHHTIPIYHTHTYKHIH